MNFKQLMILLLGYLFLGALHSNAQDIKQLPVKNKPLKWSLNEEGTHWIGIHSYAQFWTRVNQNNPGSLVSEEPQKTTTDISMRRFRFGLKGQLTDQLFIYTQFGTNNLNYLSSRKTSLDLLDAYAEYSFSKHLTVGGGKSIWDGLSRFSSPSTSKLMTTDVPFIALPNVNITDALIRDLSIFAKGKIDKVDYRLVLLKPFSVHKSSSFNPDPSEGIAKFTDKRMNLGYAGYIKYEFWQPESNKYPVFAGTYLGNKKVLNLGVGFKLLPEALWSLNQGKEQFHDMKLFAADLFLDLPVNKEKHTALTLYSAFFDYDFGPNYIRNIGANNVIDQIDPDQVSFNGKGNAFPVAGTGTAFLNQLGYLFPPMGRSKNWGQLQPYGSFQYSDFERLADPMISYDLGINWLLDGHLSKFSLNAQNHPIYFDTGNGLKVDDRKWMFVLQYQFRI